MDKVSFSGNKLYILGDLFDQWLRDSIDVARQQTVIDSFKKSVGLGLEIFLLTGNRDFMLSNKFFEKTGIKLIKEPYKINIATKNTVLAHGDKLCTDDKPYQTMRILLQNELSKFILRVIPQKLLLKFVKALRQTTDQHKTQKKPKIMDVNVVAVEKFMQKQHSEILIHGHTHLPNIHQQQNGTRYVLGDWQHDAEILILKDNNLNLITLENFLAKPKLN